MKKRELSDKNKNIISSLAIIVFAVALFFFLFFSTNLFNSDASSQAQIRKIEKKLTNIEIPEIPEAEFIDNSKENTFQGPSGINEMNDYEFIAHPLYPSFAEAEFSINSNNVLSVSDDIIYNQGYYSISGGAWTSFTLQGTPYGNGQPWVLDIGTSNLPNTLNNEGTHYVIAYSCSLVNGAWDCHENKWQLRIIKVNAPTTEPPSNSIAQFAQCLTDAGATFYGSAGCSGCRAQKALFGEDFQYVTYVNCDSIAIKPQCKAAGVDGYPTWIINGQKIEDGALSFDELSGFTGCPAP